MVWEFIYRRMLKCSLPEPRSVSESNITDRVKYRDWGMLANYKSRCINDNIFNLTAKQNFLPAFRAVVFLLNCEALKRKTPFSKGENKPVKCAKALAFCYVIEYTDIVLRTSPA